MAELFCKVCHRPAVFTKYIPDTFTCSTCIEKALREEEATRTHCICVTCLKPFYIKAKKVAELKAAGLQLFTHCYACNRRRNP